MPFLLPPHRKSIHHFKVLPINDDIIARLNAMALKDKRYEPQPRRTRTTRTARTRSIEQEPTISDITQPGISRPVRTQKALERLNLAARVEQLTTLVHMTAKKATKEYPTEAEPAIIEELTNLTRKHVLTGRYVHSLTAEQQTRVLRSHMNVTRKVVPISDGTGRTKDKLKARHVAGGDGQDRNLYSREETSSPTVSVSGLYLTIITAYLDTKSSCHCVTAVAGCAYLNAKMPQGDPTKLVFIKIAPEIKKEPD